MATPYSPNFYEGIRQGIRSSADALVPLLHELLLGDQTGPLPPEIVDVGGGEGWWAKAFEDQGAEALCIDGDYVQDHQTRFLEADLAKPLPVLPGYDLAICLEVAEHLAPERAESFVEELCRLAPVVVFSAAIPNQGGTDHLNEQWPGYWRDLFGRHEFYGTGAVRSRIWDDERIAWWYRQNLLVFSKAPYLRLQPDHCPAIVHPECFRARGR